VVLPPKGDEPVMRDRPVRRQFDVLLAISFTKE